MLLFLPDHPYFYQSTTVFTCPNDGWAGLCIKLCLPVSFSWIRPIRETVHWGPFLGLTFQRYLDSANGLPFGVLAQSVSATGTPGNVCIDPTLAVRLRIHSPSQLIVCSASSEASVSGSGSQPVHSPHHLVRVVSNGACQHLMPSPCWAPTTFCTT